MLIVLSNHSNTIVLGHGAKASKISPVISPLEEDMERLATIEEAVEDEAVPYDPRAAEEPPPIADVEPIIEGIPRAEEVELVNETNPRSAYLRRIFTEGDAFLPAEARKLTRKERMGRVKLPEGFSMTADDQSYFKERMDDLTLVNKRIDNFKKQLPSVKERAFMMGNDVEVEEIEETIKRHLMVKDEIIGSIVEFEMETGFDYDDLVEIYGGEKEAYLGYKNIKVKP